MIVWLASYPRSGNTYLRILLQRYFGLPTLSKYDDAHDIGANLALAKMVGHDHLEGSWEDVYPRLDQSPDLHFVKTHDAPTDENKAIYVLRDPRAVVVSYRRYLENFAHRSVDHLDVITGSVGFGSWTDHLTNWDPLNRPNTLFLKFEDLCTDPAPAIEQLASFLDREPQQADDIDFADLQKVAPKFFRAGSNEQNIDELDHGSVELINALYGEQMETFGYGTANTPAPSPRVQTALSEIASRLTKARFHNQHTERHLTESRALVKSIKTQLSESEAELNRSQERHEERAKALDAQTARREKVEADLEKAEAQSEPLKKELEKQRSTIASLEAHISDLKTKLASTENALRDTEESAEAEHAEADKRYQHLAAMVSTQQRELVRLKNEYGATKDVCVETQRLLKLSQTEAEKAQQSEATLAAETEKLREDLTRTHERLSILHQALAPRWRTLLTLKPLRFAYRQRQQVKSGRLQIDEHGVPVAGPADETVHPAESLEAQASLPKAEALANGHTSSLYTGWEQEKPLGIAVFAFDRAQNLEAVLESLRLQDALGTTHVFIDGDQGRPAKRKILDRTEEIAKAYDIAAIHRQRGNFGFRKMMILAIKRMFETYEHVLFLEDDCFPTRHAAAGFSYELSDIEKRDDIFSVYGHHFEVDGEEDSFPRFQGWGWATTRDKMMAVWPVLRDCYMMDEEEYLAFVDKTLTPEVRARLEATPGRSVVDTVTRFFAWDETLALLTAAHHLGHRPARERLVYNFGIGVGSTHFGANPVFRQPPFNMISPDEVWTHF